jgi:hypothetical protein
VWDEVGVEAFGHPRLGTEPVNIRVAVGSDNYVAVVVPGEQLVGGQSLELSLEEDGLVLAQPRLVVKWEVKGGRYASDVLDIYAGTGPARRTLGRRYRLARRLPIGHPTPRARLVVADRY